MRILLDTNIFIPLEDSSMALHESFSEFVRLANEHNHTLLTHPGSLDDIKRDSDQKRQQISLSRFKKYPLLETPPLPSDDDVEKLGLTCNNDNDRVDNELLFAIYKDSANILVSEDRGVHKKADKLGVSDRVHYLQQATEFLKRLHQLIPISLPNITEPPLYQVNLQQPFFDSLRNDYDGFDEWYQGAARDGRRAWVHTDSQGELGAICVYKIEENPIVTDDCKAIPGKVLKLCTFKVGDTVRGRRIGELFLKAAFRYATNNQLENVYLHTRPGRQDFLIDFCSDFGFENFGNYKGDVVLVKQHPSVPPNVTIPALEYHKRFFPHFLGGSQIEKYLVPIRPRYHRILFPDNQRQPSLFSFTGNGNFHTQVVGNAIKQAYICHAPIGGIQQGDILLFYRTTDQMAVTSIGVVEFAGHYYVDDDVMQLVSKRTVYSADEIKQMVTKKTLVILFRLTLHLQNPIPFRWLKQQAVVRGNIQTIRRITDGSFRKIVSEGQINNCLLAD